MLSNYNYSWNITWSHILTILTNYRVNIQLVLPQQTSSVKGTEQPPVIETVPATPPGDSAVPSEPAVQDYTAMETEPGPSLNKELIPPPTSSSPTSKQYSKLWKRKFTETQPEISQLGDKVKKLTLKKSLSAQTTNDLAAKRFLQDDDIENVRIQGEDTEKRKLNRITRKMKNQKQEQDHCKAFQLTDKFRVPINQHLKLTFKVSSKEPDFQEIKPIPPFILIRTFSLIRVMIL